MNFNNEPCILYSGSCNQTVQDIDSLGMGGSDHDPAYIA